jgi:5'-3' exonuclease
MTLLLVDGANILMRCAFGGDKPPFESTPFACQMIERAAADLEARYLVIALDHPDAPSWRCAEYPEYKANRTTNTAQWIVDGAEAFGRRGWHVEMLETWEADDIIATIALRSAEHTKTFVLSNDSDLLPLTTNGVEVVRPLAGGGWQRFIASDVCEKYQIPTAASLIDYKAMVGDTTDNVRGVPGIGPKKACSLLKKYGELEAIITAGSVNFSKDARLVWQHAVAARLAQRLVSLRVDVPIDPISPAKCSLRRNAA